MFNEIKATIKGILFNKFRIEEKKKLDILKDKFNPYRFTIYPIYYYILCPKECVLFRLKETFAREVTKIVYHLILLLNLSNLSFRENQVPPLHCLIPGGWPKS